GTVLGPDLRLEVATEPRREARARTTRPDRDLELAALEDRRRDECARVGYVDDVQEDARALRVGDEVLDELRIPGRGVRDERAGEVAGAVLAAELPDAVPRGH